LLAVLDMPDDQDDGQKAQANHDQNRPAVEQAFPHG
jgi:hypothetical protein